MLRRLLPQLIYRFVTKLVNSALHLRRGFERSHVGRCNETVEDRMGHISQINQLVAAVADQKRLLEDHITQGAQPHQLNSRKTSSSTNSASSSRAVSNQGDSRPVMPKVTALKSLPPPTQTSVPPVPSPESSFRKTPAYKKTSSSSPPRSRTPNSKVMSFMERSVSAKATTSSKGSNVPWPSGEQSVYEARIPTREFDTGYSSLA